MGTNPLLLRVKAGRDTLSSIRRESIIDWSWISTQVEELGMGRWVGEGHGEGNFRQMEQQRHRDRNGKSHAYSGTSKGRLAEALCKVCLGGL